MSQVSFVLSQFSVIALWWDSSFDLALIVGTFIHCLGNYEATGINEEITFVRRISQFNIADTGYAQAFRSFRVTTRATRKLFDDDFFVQLSAAKCS